MSLVDGILCRSETAINVPLDECQLLKEDVLNANFERL